MGELTGNVKRLSAKEWRLCANLPPTVRNGKLHYPRKYTTVEVAPKRKAEERLRKEAEARLYAWLAELEQAKCVDPGRLTFAGMAEQWLAVVEKLRRPATHAFYRGQLDGHILPAIGGRIAADVKPEDLRALYSAQTASGYAEYTRRHTHATIKAAYSWAVRTGKLTLNPAKQVNDPPRQKATRPRRTWDDEQIARAVAIARDGRRNCRNLVYLPLMLAGWCGLRDGEICGLRWSDVHFETGILEISRTLEQTKGGRLHVEPPKTAESDTDLPLPAELLEALEEAHRVYAGLRLARGPKWNPDDYVMVTRYGTPVKPAALSSAWASFIRRNSLPKVTLHELRHSFCTNLFDAGEDLIAVQKLARHSKASTTADLYLHKTEQKRREAMSRQDERIAAARANAAQDLRLIRDGRKSA